MGIHAPVSQVIFYQTVLSGQFTEKHFLVTDGSVKTYDLVDAITANTDVVLLNGLYQVKGPGNSYTVVGSVVTFAETSVLTSGDNIVVYYEKSLI